MIKKIASLRAQAFISLERLETLLLFGMSVLSNLVIHMIYHRLRCIGSWCYFGFEYAQIIVLNILVIDKWKWNRINTIWREILHLIEFFAILWIKTDQCDVGNASNYTYKTIIIYYFVDLLINLKKVQFYRKFKHVVRTLVQRKGPWKIMEKISPFSGTFIISFC